MELTARRRRWEDIMPVMAIRDDVIISRKGELTVGWELSLPVLCSLTEDEYDAMILRFYEAVRKLPAWTIVHRQDMYTYDTYRSDGQGGFLRRSYSGHFDGRRFLTHRAYLFLTLSEKASVSKSGLDSGYFGFRFTSPLPPAEKVSTFLSVASEFIASAFDGELSGARRLTRADLEGEGDSVGIIQNYASLGDRSPVMHDYEETRDTVSYGDRCAVSFTISHGDQLPTEICTTSEVESLSTADSHIYLSFASRLGAMLECEHVVNQYIVVPAQDDIHQGLDRTRRRMTNSLDSSDNRVNAQSMQEYLDEVNRSGLFTVRSHVNVIAWDSRDRLPDLRSQVSSAISSMKITAVYNNLNTPLVWYSGIPGAEAELGMENYMVMELLSCLCLGSWETFDRDVEGGLLRLSDRMRGIPLTMDIQSEAQRRRWIDNFNAFVLGGSGSGKSFFMNLYLRNCYDAGEHVFIIDVGDSYEGLCSIIHEESGKKDGMYHSWDISNPFSFCPFQDMEGGDGWLTERGTLRQDHPGVNFILSFLKTTYDIKGGWMSQESNILSHFMEDFVKDAVGRGGTPVLDDFYDYVVGSVKPRVKYVSPYASPVPGEMPAQASERMSRLHDDERLNGYEVGGVMVTPERFDIDGFLLSLEPYCHDGRFSFLMNDRNPKDLFSSRFVVFEVDTLSQVEDEKFYSLCILCIMNAFDRKMRSLREFKVMVIEEAWKAIANETMAPYLAGLWKTARKFATSAMVVTQQANDIISSPVIRDTILQNSNVRILLDQSNNRGCFPELQAMLGITEKERNMIFSINRGRAAGKRYKEVFIKMGDRKSGVYSTEVSPQEALAYESDKTRKAAWLERSRREGFVRTTTQMTSR